MVTPVYFKFYITDNFTNRITLDNINSVNGKFS